MRVVYAFQCSVIPPAGQTPRRCLEVLADDAQAWFRAHAKPVRGSEPPPEAALEGDYFDVIWGTVEGRDRAAVGASYPDPDNDEMDRHLSCIAIAGPRGVDLSVTLASLSRRFCVRPVPYALATVSLVPELVRKHRCQIDGQPVPTHFRQLPANDVERFVRSQLTNPRRALPAVVLAPFVAVGGYAAQPQKLQDSLLGLAEVVALTDDNAAVLFNRSLGQQLACPGGGARLYWPGFTRDADPNAHPARTAEMLETDAAAGNDLAAGLLTAFVAAAADRFCLAKVGSGLLTDRGDFEDCGEELESLRGEADRLRAENAQLSEQLQAQRSEADAARAALEAAEAEVIAVRADAVRDRNRRRLAIDQKRGRMGDGDPRKKTVAGALLAAGEDFADVLTVYDSAVDAAGRTSSTRGTAVYGILRAIVDVGLLYFEARRENRSMGPLDEAFAGRVSCKYTANESPTTVSMFGHTRVFRHQGRSKQMLRHLTLAPGDRANCVQIFFDFDDETGKVEVGYCGRHLPISQQPT